MAEVVVSTSCRGLLYGCALFKQVTSSLCFGLTQGCLKRESAAFSQRPGDAVRMTVEMRSHIGKRCLVAVLLDVTFDGNEVEGAAVTVFGVSHTIPPCFALVSSIVCAVPLGNGQPPFADVEGAEYGYNAL